MPLLELTQSGSCQITSNVLVSCKPSLMPPHLAVRMPDRVVRQCDRACQRLPWMRQREPLLIRRKLHG